MSYEKATTYLGENKTILKCGCDQFHNMAVKVKKADIAAALVDGRLPAGTVLSKDGKLVDGTTVTNDKAYGLTYRDVNFTHSNGTEMVPVTVFGFIDESILPAPVVADAKAAMKLLLFV